MRNLSKNLGGFLRFWRHFAYLIISVGLPTTRIGEIDIRVNT